MVKVIAKQAKDITVGEFFIVRNVRRNSFDRMFFSSIQRTGDTIALHYADAVTGEQVDYIRVKADDVLNTIV